MLGLSLNHGQPTRGLPQHKQPQAAPSPPSPTSLRPSQWTLLLTTLTSSARDPVLHAVARALLVAAHTHRAVALAAVKPIAIVARELHSPTPVLREPTRTHTVRAVVLLRVASRIGRAKSKSCRIYVRTLSKTVESTSATCLTMSSGITSKISCVKVSQVSLAKEKIGRRLTAPLAGEVLFADVLLLPNGMSKVGTT